MADITYTPRAPGCEVRLTTSDGHELVVCLSGVEDAQARFEGDPSLTKNRALVTLVSEYAANGVEKIVLNHELFDDLEMLEVLATQVFPMVEG